VNAWPAAGDAALGKLEADWSAAYAVRYEAGMYRAAFRYGDGVELEAGTVAGLDAAIRAHWNRVRPASGGPNWGGR